MRFFSYISDAWKTIMSNKMRSGLSTLGIVIGMAAVIVMMAIGQGAEKNLMDSMGDMAKNKLSIYVNGGYQNFDEETGKSTYIKRIIFTREIVPYIEKYFPELMGQITYQVHGQ